MLLTIIGAILLRLLLQANEGTPVEWLGEALGNILKQGGTLGAVSWVVIGGVITAWKDRWGEPTNLTKNIISIAAPVVIVFAAYFFGVFAGYWPYDRTSFVNAISVLAVEIAGSKTIFVTSRGIETMREGNRANVLAKHPDAALMHPDATVQPAAALLPGVTTLGAVAEPAPEPEPDAYGDVIQPTAYASIVQGGRPSVTVLGAPPPPPQDWPVVEDARIVLDLDDPALYVPDFGEATPEPGGETVAEQVVNAQAEALTPVEPAEDPSASPAPASPAAAPKTTKKKATHG
jgi:hypothetical protein